LTKPTIVPFAGAVGSVVVVLPDPFITTKSPAVAVLEMVFTTGVRVCPTHCPYATASVLVVPFAKPVIFWELSVNKPADEKLAKTVPAEFFHSCRFPVCEAMPETVNGTVVVAVVLMLTLVSDGEVADT
jgi:hypothetical protein